MLTRLTIGWIGQLSIGWPSEISRMRSDPKVQTTVRARAHTPTSGRICRTDGCQDMSLAAGRNKRLIGEEKRFGASDVHAVRQLECPANEPSPCLLFRKKSWVVKRWSTLFSSAKTTTSVAGAVNEAVLSGRPASGMVSDTGALAASSMPNKTCSKIFRMIEAISVFSRLEDQESFELYGAVKDRNNTRSFRA